MTPRKSAPETARRLVLVLGDQLDPGNGAVTASDPERDVVVLVETKGEGAHVWSHRQRIALFIAAMRHRAQALRDDGWTVDHATLDDDVASLADGLRAAAERWSPEEIHVVEPGEWRVQEMLRETAHDLDLELIEFDDAHFYNTRAAFSEWAEGRKTLRMEHFYRALRKREQVLLEEPGDGSDPKDPVGGKWNYDAENRGSFGKDGPGDLPLPPAFEPDAITAGAIEDVARHFPEHPGSLDSFAWPVTPEDAQVALDDFIEHRLPEFGTYQDAMWSGEPFLYHALLSPALNLKLLDPRDAVTAAEEAYHAGRAPLASVEGFIRQILGWREYIRGIYWHLMPDYADENHYGHDRPLPDWFWTGETDLHCLSQVIGQTLEHGYAHHIQRLMIIGNYATLAGIEPKQVQDWFLAVYVDAVEWVELPNVVGMALHADGGVLATKPYVSTGQYVKRMSDYCSGCRYRPDRRTGDDACPFTTLYWDFMRRNRDELAGNPRTAKILGNLDRWSEEEIDAIAARAAELRGE